MGIHGEPGAEKQIISHLNPATMTHDLVHTMCMRLDSAMLANQDLSSRCTGLAILVNNLGAVAQSEMLIITKAVADFLHSGKGEVLSAGLHRVQLYVGAFMTSLQMTGVSLSVFMMPTDGGIMKQLLHERTACTAWSAGFQLCAPQARPALLRSGDGASLPASHAPASNVYLPSGQSTTGGYAGVPPPAPSVCVPVPAPVQVTPPSQAVGEGGTNRAQGRGSGSTAGVYTGGVPKSGAAAVVTGLSPKTDMVILKITSVLQSHCDELADLDRKTGDGDLGDTGTC